MDEQTSPGATIAALAEVVEEMRSNGPGEKARRFNEALIVDYRATGGKRTGELPPASIVLLTMKGAKSGIERTVPVGVEEIDGRLVVVASSAGLPKNPQWYNNIVANPVVTVEWRGDTFRAEAVVTQGEDRDYLIGKLNDVYRGYQAQTTPRSRLLSFALSMRTDSPARKDPPQSATGPIGRAMCRAMARFGIPSLSRRSEAEDLPVLFERQWHTRVSLLDHPERAFWCQVGACLFEIIFREDGFDLLSSLGIDLVGCPDDGAPRRTEFSEETNSASDVVSVDMAEDSGDHNNVSTVDILIGIAHRCIGIDHLKQSHATSLGPFMCEGRIVRMEFDQKASNVGAPRMFFQRADHFPTLTTADAHDRHRIVFARVHRGHDACLHEPKSEGKF